MVVWWVRSHIVLQLDPILCWTSLPYCLNTFVCVYGEFAPILYARCKHRCIHTWNMQCAKNNATCEHICMHTGTLQVRNRDAMSVSESIDSSRLLMSASELRANAHRRRLQQIKPTSTVFLVKSFRIEWVVVVVVDVVVAVVAPNLYLITSPLLAIYGS